MPPSDFTCPACGEDVHPNSKSCPNCGAEPEGGWASGGEIIDGTLDLDIPDEDFDYDEYIAREFDKDGRARVTPRLHPAWIITALALVVAILILIASGLW